MCKGYIVVHSCSHTSKNPIRSCAVPKCGTVTWDRQSVSLPCGACDTVRARRVAHEDYGLAHFRATNLLRQAKRQNDPDMQADALKQLRSAQAAYTEKLEAIARQERVVQKKTRKQSAAKSVIVEEDEEDAAR